MNHKAIYNTHPTVVSIDDTEGASDINGNPVILDQALVDEEVIRLQAEYDALAWKRNRKAEYPTIEELVVALYDTEDKLAIQTRRAEVKAKYTKS